jgi:hypothetical protein
VLAIFALMVFSAYVAREIHIREQGTGLLSAIALTAGRVAVALGQVSAIARGGVAGERRHHARDSPGTAFIAIVLGFIWFIAASVVLVQRAT